MRLSRIDSIESWKKLTEVVNWLVIIMTSKEPIAPEKFGGVLLTMLRLYFVIENNHHSVYLLEPARTVVLQTYTKKDSLCFKSFKWYIFYIYLHNKSPKEIWNALNKKYGVYYG